MKKPSQESRHSLCTSCGLCLAISMLTALSIVSLSSMRHGGRSLTADNGAKVYNPSDSAVTEITVAEPVELGFDDSEVVKRAYKEYKKNFDAKEKKKDKDEDTVIQEDTQSTTSATSSTGDEQTTVTTTVTSQTSSTTAANRDPEQSDTERVSNNMQPFNYNDVSSIADDLSTLGDFVDKLSPSSVSWDCSEFSDNGCIKVTLESNLGSVTLHVKPLTEDFSEIEQSGSINSDEIINFQWLDENRGAGCNISSVTWTDATFGIVPVRKIGIGATLAQLTDGYLCVNGGATTLYRASDVIKDQNKLNSILAAENLYTFVGGRVYSIGSYLDKYYNGKEHTFKFEDCDYIVQYGCNSIMEHNYTTGSWIIEYAVREDSVVGISFMNKSYYRTEQKTAVSTNISSSGSESGAVTTTHAESSETSDDISDELTNELSSEQSKEEHVDVFSEAEEEVSSEE